MTVVYKLEVFPDPALNAGRVCVCVSVCVCVCARVCARVCVRLRVTHPLGHWWSRSPGCAPSSPSPVRPAGWCIPSRGSACCAPTGSIYPAAHARLPPAAAAACCSPSGFYGDVSPLQTQPAATCWLLPADWDKLTKMFKVQSAVLSRLLLLTLTCNVSICLYVFQWNTVHTEHCFYFF